MAVTAQEFIRDIGILIYLIFLNAYYWLQALYRNLFPTYKSVKDDIVLITGAGIRFNKKT